MFTIRWQVNLLSPTSSLCSKLSTQAMSGSRYCTLYLVKEDLDASGFRNWDR